MLSLKKWRSRQRNPAQQKTRGRRRGGVGVFHVHIDCIFNQFMQAVGAGESTVILQILETGLISLDDIDRGSAALELACKREDVMTLLVLLHKGISPDLCIDGNFSALHKAAQTNSISVADVLLDHGARVDLPTKCDKRTPLHLAASTGNVRAIKLFLDRGADIESRDIYGSTPLMAATASECKCTIRALLGRNAKTEAYNKEGWTSLLIAVEAGNIDLAKLLVENNAYVDCQTRTGLTPLHCACRNNNAEMVAFLLKHQANANIKDRLNRKPHERANDSQIIDILVLNVEEHTLPVRSIGEDLFLKSEYEDLFIQCPEQTEERDPIEQY